MALFSQNRKVALIPTEARKVSMSPGPAIRSSATLMLALASGLNLIQSCRTANYAAAWWWGNWVPRPSRQRL